MADILRPVPQSKVSQGPILKRRYLLGLWEPALRQGAEFAERRPDSGNIIILADEKTDEDLPQILPQNPHSLPILRRSAQICILRIDPGSPPFIIRIHIKIGAPKCSKLPLIAGYVYTCFYLARLYTAP